MADDSGDAGDRRHQPDCRLVPMLLCQQINTEIGAEPALYVGEKEIEPVEGSAVERWGLFAKTGHLGSRQIEPQRADANRQDGQWRTDFEIFPEADFDVLRPRPLHDDQVGHRADQRKISG